MIAFLLSPLGRLVGVGALCLLIGGFIGYRIEYGALQALKAATAERDLKDTNAALDKFKGTAASINAAALAYAGFIPAMDAQFQSLSTELKNVKVKAPLPALCRPDPERLRVLTASVQAANDAALGR